jgi:predicted nucleic acid-binding Zn finger protein
MGYRNLESIITDFLNVTIELPRTERAKRVFSLAAKKIDSLLKLMDAGIELIELNDGRTVMITTNRCYLIYRYFFCSCNDFYLRNLAQNKSEPCKHIFAVLYMDLTK